MSSIPLISHRLFVAAVKPASPPRRRRAEPATAIGKRQPRPQPVWKADSTLVGAGLSTGAAGILAANGS